MARAALVKEHGCAFLSDVDGRIGTGEHRIWLKSDAPYSLVTDDLEEASISALYSRPVAAFWHAHIGIRGDATGANSRNWAGIGLEGLAPYFFHVDAAVRVSFHGEVVADIESSTDVLLTQRLVLQPRIELDFAAQDIVEIGTGAGLTVAELGLRLRDEIRREIAPYVGVSWTHATGRTADFVRAAGEDAGGASFVAGLLLRF